MKIAIIGYSGSGKATLARFMGSRSGFDVLHIDKIHWLPGWVECDKISQKREITSFLDSHSSWIIDGTYPSICFERRLDEADIIIFMCFNRISCLLRALRRYRLYRGKSRECVTEGCQEKIDAEFLKWLLFTGRSRRLNAAFREIEKKYRQKTVTIKTQRQLEQYKTYFETYSAG